MNSRQILILGVTASGKGRLVFELARQLDAEIISIDSMKVYRQMDIGTAKPPKHARSLIKYHLIDILEPSESFSAGLFLDAAYGAIKQIKTRNKPIIAVGGTALYIKALLYGLFDGPGADNKIREQLQQQVENNCLEDLYRELKVIDPQAAARISKNDAKRIIRALEVYKITGKPISQLQKQFNAEKPKQKWIIIGLRREKAAENSRINTRVRQMFQQGLIEEVKSLLAEDKPLSKQAASAIGYAEITKHLEGKITIKEAIELIKKNTRRLAKNQRTWFKTFKNINWIDIESDQFPEQILKQTKQLLTSPHKVS